MPRPGPSASSASPCSAMRSATCAGCTARRACVWTGATWTCAKAPARARPAACMRGSRHHSPARACSWRRGWTYGSRAPSRWRSCRSAGATASTWRRPGRIRASRGCRPGGAVSTHRAFVRSGRWRRSPPTRNASTSRGAARRRSMAMPRACRRPAGWMRSAWCSPTRWMPIPAPIAPPSTACCSWRLPSPASSCSSWCGSCRSTRSSTGWWASRW